MYSFHESKITQVSDAKQPKISELRPVHEKNNGFAYCVLFAYAKHLGILLIITSNLHLIQNN